MAQRCTLGAWTTNSQVVTAVSDTPTGPYVRQAIAIPPWSHNPEAIHTPDGKFVIFTLGPGKGKTVEKNCTRGDYVPDAADEAALVGEVSTRANLPPPGRAQANAAPPPGRSPQDVESAVSASTRLQTERAASRTRRLLLASLGPSVAHLDADLGC